MPSNFITAAQQPRSSHPLNSVLSQLEPPTSLDELPRERKRPVRTYGKRSASSRDVELPSKKQKLETADLTGSDPASSSPRLPRLPELSQSEPLKRGSILTYFKPLPSSSSVPVVSSSDTVEPTLTPPSSPIPLPKARERRRLATQLAIDGGTSGVNGNETNQKENCRDEGHDDTQDPSLNACCDGTAPLGEANVNILGGEVLIRNAARKPRKQPAKEKVQTTLSLAINPGPGFTICKECGVLYNPLNEKDRKEHKKQHAAYLRSKAKARVG